MEIKQRKALITVIGTGLALAMGFQNCSDVSFQDAASQSKSDVVALDRRGCNLEDGSMIADGQSFSTTHRFELAINCPNGPRLSRGFINAQDFICDDGTVKPNGSAITPEGEMPECPAPSLEATVTPSYPLSGEQVKLVVRSEYVQEVSYRCVESISGESGDEQGDLVSEGPLEVGQAERALTVHRDLVCYVTAKNSENQRLDVQIDVPVNCGQRLKVNGECRDFACQTVQLLAQSKEGDVETASTLIPAYQVPARTKDGVCYAVKLANKIANGPSSLTTERDPSIISRNHNSNNNNIIRTHNPYLLAQAQLKYFLQGARTVRLAGALSSTASIKVDNFIVVGITPRHDDGSTGEQDVRAYGTADSTLPGTDHILLNNQPLALKPFGSGGTSTINPLDITASSVPMVEHLLDLRALDCGGARELSEIYLLFQ